MEGLISAACFVFLFLVCPIQETVTALGGNSFTKFVRLENKTLGHVFRSNIERSATHCCIVCSHLPKCAAVNYFLDTGRCELNEKSPLDHPSSALSLNVATGVDVYYSVDCDEPVPHGNASLSPGSVRNGSTRAYVCENGYGVNGSSTTSYAISCFNGSWVYGSSRCREIVPTIGQGCSVSSDCVETAAVCMIGTCFCGPLYRYNSTIKNCLKVCTAMTNTFVEYPGQMISGYAHYCSIKKKNCHNVCANDTACLFYNKHDSGSFYLGSTTREMIIDAIPGALIWKLSVTLFSKKCV